MDPNKSNFLHKVLFVILYIILYCMYFVLKVFYFIKGDKEYFVEPDHLIEVPSIPISSRKLAQALNPKTPENILKILANSDDKFLRRALCRNPSLPKNLLKQMIKDPDPMVANEAKRIINNPTFKSDELHALN
tara:strand:- start:1363 stop:1761 length:399 start_codon:yes stop_codon:yes gene_type:complete